jgi:hypothetical protein
LQTNSKTWKHVEVLKHKEYGNKFLLF